MKAKWKGDPKILPDGVEVTILAVDPDDPDTQFGRQACWIKWLMEGFTAPMYRSCNMDDLEFEKPPTDIPGIRRQLGERYPVITAYLAGRD